jgi:adenylate kinase
MLVDGQWTIREDDEPETVRRRLEVYRDLTSPLTAFYAEAGLLRAIRAMDEIDAVTVRALDALGRRALPIP